MKALLPVFVLFSFAMHAQSVQMSDSTKTAAFTNCCCHNDSVLAQRDPGFPVYDMNGQLEQEAVVIGKCSTFEVTRDGERIKFLQYYLPNGVQVAEAVYVINSNVSVVTTSKDGITQAIPIRPTMFPEDQVAEFLALHFYM